MVVNRSTNTWIGPAKSEQFMSERSSVPQVSAIMASSVSQTRRQTISDEVEHGLFRDGSSSRRNENGLTSNAVVTSSVGMKKYGQAVSSSGNMFHGVHGDTVKQTPEVYSPLWLN